MSDRRGVALLMFDLPAKTSEERRAYTLFRKMMIRHGYRQFQKSVYIKLLRNISSYNNEFRWMEKQSPEQGCIHMMEMTLNEFRTLTAIRGNPFPMNVFADDMVFIGDTEEEEWTDDELLVRSERGIRDAEID